ncbi:MAG: serine/threonine-protein phosphatase [Telmatospirillum sp.]|nr:serine/threonine-protein phosphatase [Telmatospirillum sp.]
MLRPVSELPSFGRTHVGTRRAINQDALLIRADIGLWAVADGLGGHEAGEVASATVIEALEDVLPPLSLGGLIDDVRDALTGANDKLRDRARLLDDDATIASTAVALMVYANRYICVWVGDSRAYLLRGGALSLLTRDHVALDLADHTRPPLVTRAVGADDRIEIDLVQGTLEPGDRFLLCSDGVSRVLTDGELAALLSGRPPRETVDDIIEGILVGGAPDNLTAVVVDSPLSGEEA